MTIYYVKKHAGKSEGTEANPFHTLNEANKAAKPKDIVLVGPGTYYETLKLETPDVYWLNWEEELPVLDGRYAPGERLPNGNMPAEDAKKKYLPGSDYGKMVDIRAEKVRFEGFVIQNVAGQPVGMYANGAQLINCIIDHAYGGAINAANCSGITIQGNVIQRCNQKRYDPTNEKGGPAGVQVTVLLKTVKNAVVIGNEISYNHGEGLGISLDSEDCLIRDNVIHTNLHMQIVVNHAQNNTFDANFVYHDGTEEFLQRSSGDAPAGIMITDEHGRASQGWKPSRGNRFINNIVAFCSDSFNVRSSKNSSGALRDTLVAHNTFYEALAENTEAFGIRIPPSDHSNSHFINNIVYQSTGTVALVPGGKGITFANNNWSRLPDQKARGKGDTVGDPGFTNHDREFPLPIDFLPRDPDGVVIGKAQVRNDVRYDYFQEVRDGLTIGAIDPVVNVEPDPPDEEEPTPDPVPPVPAWVIEELHGIIAQAAQLLDAARGLLEAAEELNKSHAAESTGANE